MHFPRPSVGLAPGIQKWLRQPANLLFAASLLIYAVTRFYRISDYPIYFFSDEAIQTVNAADLVRNGFRDHWGAFLPAYFENEFLFNVSLSVYLQVVPFLLFGRSVAVTRAAAALVTMAGVTAAALFLRRAFRLHLWWAVILFLAATPAWFLHSRTAFETSLMVACFAVFLHLYLLYRTRSPIFLYPALVAAGLIFYSYSPGQVVTLALLGALFLSDFRYHLEHRRIGLVGLLIVVFMLVPYIRFQEQHPGAMYYHLRVVNSYWFAPIPFAEKLGLLARNYLLGLSPDYWYVPNGRDLPRHLMDGFGHILAVTLPLALIGLWTCLRDVRSSPNRLVLISLLVSPVGGAMAETGVTRALAFVVPAAMLTTLGLETALKPTFRRWGAWRPSLAVLAGGGLISLLLLVQALVLGPTWTRDYGLGGMQYGARQVFAEIAEILKQDDEARLLLSPTWANGTDILARFFAPDEDRLELLNVDGILGERQNLDSHTVAVMTPSEYERAVADPKLAHVSVQRVLPYPDGRDGFYFVTLDYSERAEALWAEEAAARRQPVLETIRLFDRQVQITHSVFEEGQLSDIFDQDTFSLVRTARVNPAVLIFEFPSPLPVSGLTITTGTMDIGLTATLHPHDGSGPQVFRRTFTGLPADPTVQLRFHEASILVDRVELLIEKLGDNEEAHVHLREVELY